MNLKLKMFCNYRAKIWPHSPQQNYELSKLSKVLLFDDVSTRTRSNNKLETIKGVFEIQNLRYVPGSCMAVDKQLHSKAYVYWGRG